MKFALESEWIGLDMLVNIFDAWVSDSEGLVLQYNDPHTFEKTNIAVKCAKRGNDVYRWRVKESLRKLEDLTYQNEIRFFKKGDLKPKTKCVFFVLTYDTKRCSMKEAWENVGVEFNRFMSWLRRRFGEASCFRTWEAFDNGYPHINAIVFFREREFSVWWDKASTSRIQEKREFEGGWHSFIDVEAVENLGSSFRYLLKYVWKVHNRESGSRDVKHDKTLSLMWLYRKRAFGLSGQFLRDLRQYRLDYGVLHNSNSKVQSDLYGNLIVRRWVFLGMADWGGLVALCKIGRRDLWHFEIDGLPSDLWKPHCEGVVRGGGDSKWFKRVKNPFE